MSLVWEEPPARPRAKLTLQDQLRARPAVWAKVMTGSKVQVSRLGGELHRQGFEINMADKPDGNGAYSLFAQWNPGERTTTVLRPGSEDAVSTETLLDAALTHLLEDIVVAVQQRQDGRGPDLEELCGDARRDIRTLFTGPDAVRRYLRGAQTPAR